MSKRIWVLLVLGGLYITLVLVEDTPSRSLALITTVGLTVAGIILVWKAEKGEGQEVELDYENRPLFMKIGDQYTAERVGKSKKTGDNLYLCQNLSLGKRTYLVSSCFNLPKEFTVARTPFNRPTKEHKYQVVGINQA